MVHYWSLESVYLHNAWLTIGSFDGVHRGHQAIVRKLVSEAHSAGAHAVVLTFYPHPAVVLGKRQDSFYLTSPEERAILLGQLGVDIVVTHPFNPEVAALSAQGFMTYLKKHLGLSRLFVGYDFALGRGREGNVPRLQELGSQLDYSVELLSPFEVDGQVVSSSLIRNVLSEGDAERAARLLGRPYRIPGQVIPGDGRGRTIGIPTANLDVWPQRALPKAGVYVCRAWVNGQSWGAVSNVGVRPTFESQPVQPRVEAHILDFDQDLYGQTIQLDFLSRVRDEQRFPNVQALIDQIHQDVKTARDRLAAVK